VERTERSGLCLDIHACVRDARLILDASPVTLASNVLRGRAARLHFRAARWTKLREDVKAVLEREAVEVLAEAMVLQRRLPIHARLRRADGAES
jgi:hypothetical protein